MKFRDLLGMSISSLWRRKLRTILTILGVIIGTASRVLVVPLVVLGTSVLLTKHTDFFNMAPAAYPALLALFGSPVAVSSAIMAQEMDNDGVLAGQLVVWTSFVSIATLFFFIFALRALGLL